MYLSETTTRESKEHSGTYLSVPCKKHEFSIDVNLSRVSKMLYLSSVTLLFFCWKTETYKQSTVSSSCIDWHNNCEN